MNCENCFCIYYENGQCLLENISLNILGMCENCVTINIDEETLQKEREKGLARD